MCDDFGWDSEDFEMREARRAFKAAMVQQFNGLYGTDQNDLPSWQRLCCILDIDPVPDRTKECREVSPPPRFPRSPCPFCIYIPCRLLSAVNC
jgi:hypothetical protein